MTTICVLQVRRVQRHAHCHTSVYVMGDLRFFPRLCGWDLEPMTTVRHCLTPCVCVWSCSNNKCSVNAASSSIIPRTTRKKVLEICSQLIGWNLSPNASI